MSAQRAWARRGGGSPFARVAVDVGSTFAEEVARLRLEAMTSWLRQHPHLTWTAGSSLIWLLRSVTRRPSGGRWRSRIRPADVPSGNWQVAEPAR